MKSENATMTRRPLNDYLALEYPFQVIADPDGGYVIKFPDLPGCFTQVDDINDIGAMAEEIRTLWIETEYDLEHDIPLPSHPDEAYSGKFVVRVGPSLHKQLVEDAKREGMSLNQYIVALLARRDAQVQIERRMDELTPVLQGLYHQVGVAREHLTYAVLEVPLHKDYSYRYSDEMLKVG